jgi:hydrogenase expression/formation protein HypC
VKPGEYVIVHVGFALSVIDESEAKLVFEFLDGMNELEELRADDAGDGRAERTEPRAARSES